MAKKIQLLVLILVVCTLLFTPVLALQKFEEDLDTLSANVPRHISINKEEFHITEIELMSNEDVSEDCSPGYCYNMIKVVKVNNPPFPVPIEYKGLYYYEINVPESLNENITSAKISFYINNASIYGFDKSDVVLLRLHNNEWEELETELIKEESVIFTYRAKSSKFSFFAIAVRKGGEIVTEEPIIEAEEQVVEEEPIVSEEPEERTEEGISLTSTHIFYIIIAVLIIFSAYFLLSRARIKARLRHREAKEPEKEEDKEEKE